MFDHSVPVESAILRITRNVSCRRAWRGYIILSPGHVGCVCQVGYEWFDSDGRSEDFIDRIFELWRSLWDETAMTGM